MPITVAKELQTSTSSTTAYGMTIQSMSSRTLPDPKFFLGNPNLIRETHVSQTPFPSGEINC